MTQEDYLKMSDDELSKLAERYRIPSKSFTKEDPDDIEADFYFDREKVVEALLVRDEALRARRTTIISVVALAVSVTALLVSILK